MTFEEAEAYLYSLKHRGAKYGIDRMRVLMDRLGNPGRGVPMIHVAGTNGKGSVCAMLESIYRKAGYKTGLFTSPHLLYVGERVMLGGKAISKEELVGYIERLRPIADSIAAVNSDDHPSFFEFINAIAFQYFEDKGVDIAIIETGLGGEKDSTNVIEPLVSVITTVSWDHAEILGNSLELIARAKAGIIKDRVPVVVGALCEEARSVVDVVAKDKNAEVFRIGSRFGDKFPLTSLVGTHQLENAGIAQLACEVVREALPLSEEHIKEGLQRVKWPGRFEEVKLPNGERAILDIAHNEEGVVALVEVIKQLGIEPTIILGATTESRAEVLIRRLGPYARRFIILDAESSSRLIPARTIIDMVQAVGGISFNCLTISEIGSFEWMGSGETVLVAGSIYVVAEFLKALMVSDL